MIIHEIGGITSGITTQNGCLLTISYDSICLNLQTPRYFWTCMLYQFLGAFSQKLIVFGRFARRWAILFEITVPQHHIPINHLCLMDEGCYGSCPYCFIWLGKQIANLKKAKQTLFGICVRLVVFVAVLIILEAVLQQFLRVDFSKKGLYHSGVWFHTKRPEICSNC